MRPTEYISVWLGTTIVLLTIATFATSVDAQSQAALTPLQLRIETQRARLSSLEEEDRRDAVSQLGAMKHPDASRAALPALKDLSASVRATTASAILALPSEESASSLIPLLSDKDEFVRRETAYALGKTRSRSATVVLIERLLADKQDGVRGAAAVALGEISDRAAVPALAAALSSQLFVSGAKATSKSKKEQNPFVRRAAARSLGQIGSSEAVPALIAVLQDEKTEDDIKRESATALGLIGDASSLPALRATVSARDPYLSKAAYEAVQAILRLKS